MTDTRAIRTSPWPDGLMLPLEMLVTPKAYAVAGVPSGFVVRRPSYSHPAMPPYPRLEGVKEMVSPICNAVVRWARKTEIVRAVADVVWASIT